MLVTDTARRLCKFARILLHTKSPVRRRCIKWKRYFNVTDLRMLVAVSRNFLQRKEPTYFRTRAIVFFSMHYLFPGDSRLRGAPLIRENDQTLPSFCGASYFYW